MIDQLPTRKRTHYLVRVGACGETVRSFAIDQSLFQRGDQVVLKTESGNRLARVLQLLPESGSGKDSPRRTDEELIEENHQILRLAKGEDVQQQQALELRAKQDFSVWNDRIRKWNIEVELVDLEWTLDGENLTLYVLNSRGPECTKLALQASAQGQGVIDVISVSATGINDPVKVGGGCGCGSGGCSK